MKLINGTLIAAAGLAVQQPTLAYSSGNVGIGGAVSLHDPSNSSTMYRSTNMGGSWSTVGGLSVNNARLVADPANASKFYVYNPADGSFMISTDAGVSFWKFSTLAARHAPRARVGSSAISRTSRIAVRSASARLRRARRIRPCSSGAPSAA